MEVAAAAHAADCYNLQYSTGVPGSQSSTASGPSWWAYRSASHCARRAGATAGCKSQTGGRCCCSARHTKVVSSADRATTTEQPPSGPGHCGGGRGRADWVPVASSQRGSTRTTTPSNADCLHVRTSGRARLPARTALSTAVARHSNRLSYSTGRLSAPSSSAIKAPLSSAAPQTSAAMDTRVCYPGGVSTPGCRGSHRPRTPLGTANQYAGGRATPSTRCRKRSCQHKAPKTDTR